MSQPETVAREALRASIRALLDPYDSDDPPCMCGRSKSTHGNGVFRYGDDCPGFLADGRPKTMVVDIGQLLAALGEDEATKVVTQETSAKVTCRPCSGSGLRPIFCITCGGSGRVEPSKGVK
jgi:hypothetical protein